MPRLAANLGYLFTERPLIERFGAAAAAGFGAVELLFPYEVAASAVRAELARYGLTQLGINTPLGRDGQPGLAAVPGREREWQDAFALALDYAVVIGARSVHCLAGCVPPEQRPAADAVFIRNLSRAAEEAAKAGIVLLIEPINPRDRPGYFLNRVEHAADIVGKVGAPNLRIQFDFYHAQIVGGDLLRRFETHLPLIAMYRSPACRRGASRMRAKSTIRKSSRRSTGLAMRASSAANTARAGALRMGLLGRGLMGFCRATSAVALLRGLNIDVSWL
jgi:2-dehydrotetronate isomerase